MPGDNYGESLFENPGVPGHHWISLRLVGVKTDGAAIGAKIRVVLPKDWSGSSLRYREVTSGGSFGANSLRQHIGIGEAPTIERLEIEWPVSHTTQMFQSVPIDSYLVIRELEDGFSLEHPRVVHLAGPEPEPAHVHH